MARSLPPRSWQRGFAEFAQGASPPWSDQNRYRTEDGQHSHYTCPDPEEKFTSTVSSNHDTSSMRTWPGLYNGTLAKGPRPLWWEPSAKVDVLICGAGPFGLEIAMILSRLGISARIIDTAKEPCLTGRADAIQPRALEYLRTWGIDTEVSDEGPLLNKTVLYYKGKKLFHNHSSMCDSRFKGIHTMSQGDIERIYIRDLLRHKVLIERRTRMESFAVNERSSDSYPVQSRIINLETGEMELIRSKYLIGADGAASQIRSMAAIPFDGLATDCLWAIIEFQVSTDYPHILDFSVMAGAEDGGVIIIPREQGLTRFYVQITGERSEAITAARKQRREGLKNSTIEETEVHDHGISPDEVLVLLNKIMSPWKVDLSGEIAWFAVWRVNERVARWFSTPDQRVHIGGDAAHVHSVLGAFGLNSSIYDAVNLSWKLGLCLKGAAQPSILLPTYDAERRLFANRVIRCSGAYLRFICNLKLPLASLRGLDDNMEVHEEELPMLDGSISAAQEWLGTFFGRNAMFLLGVEGPIVTTPITPSEENANAPHERPTTLHNGVRAPNPRICISSGMSSYLYDAMSGLDKFHIILFVSNIQGPILERVSTFTNELVHPNGFFHRYGGSERFNVLIIFKGLTHEAESLMAQSALKDISHVATMLYDDRPPDDDAHYWYGVNHARGAVLIIRPDLIVGKSAWPEETNAIEDYFSSILLPVERTV